MYYLSDLCCTCLKKSDKLINLTNKDSDGLSFADKFKMCAFNFIFHNLMADQPLFICQLCCHNLKSMYNFRKMSMENTKTFRGYISRLKNVTQEFPNSYFDVDIEISNYDVKKCYFPSKKLLTRDNNAAKNNNTLLNSTNKMKIECDTQVTSNVSDNLKINLHTHKNMDNANKVLSISNITNNNTGLQEFPNDAENTDHSNDPEYENFITRLRNFVTEMREDNSETEHNINNSADSPETFSSAVDDFDEQLANFDFETFAEMQQNAIKSETANNSVTDDISKPTPSTNGSFKHYSNTGIAGKSAKYPKKRYSQYCKICDKHLSSNMQRHLLIHSGIKRYKCQECGSAFTRKEHLQRHTESRHVKTERKNEKKPVFYKCFECGRIFNSKKSVTNHLRTQNCFRVKNNSLDVSF